MTMARPHPVIAQAATKSSKNKLSKLAKTSQALKGYSLNPRDRAQATLAAGGRGGGSGTESGSGSFLLDAALNRIAQGDHWISRSYAGNYPARQKGQPYEDIFGNLVEPETETEEMPDIEDDAIASLLDDNDFGVGFKDDSEDYYQDLDLDTYDFVEYLLADADGTDRKAADKRLRESKAAQRAAMVDFLRDSKYN